VLDVVAKSAEGKEFDNKIITVQKSTVSYLPNGATLNELKRSVERYVV
jgi:hypothetical protein